jgi:hypothetical protein
MVIAASRRNHPANGCATLAAQHMKLSSYLQVMKTTESQANMALLPNKYEAEDI